MNTTATPPSSYPRVNGSPVLELPIESEGPTPFFPPVCYSSHWNPTAILKRTLPDQKVGLALDFRPWAKICMEYRTSGEEIPGPEVPASVTLPSGGEFYPNSRYVEAIDSESDLRRLDRPLGTCEGDQFFPNEKGDMFNARLLIPRTTPYSNPALIEEIAFPQVLLRPGPYDCRAANDLANLTLSSDRLFNAATKQDRYKTMVGEAATKPTPSSLPVVGTNDSPY